MTFEEFYGEHYNLLKVAEEELIGLLAQYSTTKREKEGVKPIVYSCSRIKSPDSMLRKLENRGFEQTINAALNEVFDAVGIRAVCPFAEDVYRLAKWLKQQSSIRIVEEKDYYAYPKPNGYRSYHILLEIASGSARGYHAEMQIRTIANDFWATLEHQLKYKQNIPNEKLIRNELKRCADEIASVDLSMQTIRDIIREGQNSDKVK